MTSVCQGPEPKSKLGQMVIFWKNTNSLPPSFGRGGAGYRKGYLNFHFFKNVLSELSDFPCEEHCLWVPEIYGPSYGKLWVLTTLPQFGLSY